MTIHVINANTTGLSEYDLDFLAVRELNGRVYGITTTGLYELTGADDAGTDIDAYIELGYQDFGNDNLKHVEHFYSDHVASNGLALEMTHVKNEDDVTHDYTLRATTGTKSQNGRTKLAKGARGRWWKAKISNVDGGTMEVHRLELLVNTLPRKM